MGSFTILRDLDYTVSPTETSSKEKTWNPKSTLDLYLPNEKPPSRRKDVGKNKHISEFPIVLFVHGGGWRRGDKSAWKHYISFHDTNIFAALILWYFNLYGNVGESLVRHNIACAIVNYPLGKLSFPHILLEMFASFLSSSLCFSLPTLYLWVTLKVLEDLLIYRAGSSQYLSQLFEYDYIHITTVLFLCVTMSQLLKIAVIFWNKKRYKMTDASIMLHILLVLGSGITIIFLIPSSTVPKEQMFKMWCAGIIVYTEGIIFYKYMTELDSTNNSNQAEAVAKSIAWIKKYGHMTSSFNPDWLFLMGHSAGGHLVSLVTLNGRYLAAEECSRSDIKGVISISGVYNVKMLAIDKLVGFVKHFYIHPIFGSSQDNQEEASPSFHLDFVQSDVLPPFLILNAEKDYMLLNDAKDFVAKRKMQGHEWEHVVVPGTNHLNIMTCFGQTKSACNPASLCARFIGDILKAVPKSKY
ncbi:uncharacterized protein LOC106158514 [Lingula anatina]|uniref:Uncharacterized protein LOC106158514 n=1 Tax=Lingula anatina TaxID=7574 RepID=A0A1S3HVE0_LINAN|nr:uncharacterized protein LOC106158514 [Lingula anatina]XP_013389994.1 uncharacterized protein LOC106158514 [Lingula anatina]|eukprot:XP_013389993.1 uncharacterized protein LOC106158514 [Lingula anatina]